MPLAAQGTKALAAQAGHEDVSEVCGWLFITPAHGAPATVRGCAERDEKEVGAEVSTLDAQAVSSLDLTI